MIEIISVKDIKDATPEELANLRRKGLLPAEETRRISGRPLSSYERTRAQVAATGNRWAMENFIDAKLQSELLKQKTCKRLKKS